MNLNEVYDQFELGGEESLEWFGQQIAKLRTGRIRPDLVDSIVVELYGARTPLKGLATITNTDARTLVISPWDPGALPEVKKAIMTAAIGVQPIEDGKVLRLSFPSLTEEIRQQTIKTLHRTAEEARVRLRRSRDDALGELKKSKQDKTLTEDDFYEGKEKLDGMIDRFNQRILEAIKKKEGEIMSV